MHDDEIVDLDLLLQGKIDHCTPAEKAACDTGRRNFVIGAGAGLLVLAAGCGMEDPRIETGGIDNQPGQLPDTPDMAQGKTTGGTNGGTNGGTTGSTNGGTTGSTNGGTTGSTNGGTTGSTNGGTTGSTNGGTTGTSGGTTGTSGGTTGGTTGAPATCASNFVSAGASSAVAVGKAKRIRTGNLDAWLCHDSMGFYALDNYCPHRGCAVNFQSSGGFACPCHGWTFNFNGNGSYGNMDHLAVCIDASGNAAIDPNTTVSASTRA